MALSDVLRTCGILLYFLYTVCATNNITEQSWILSFKISAKSCSEYKCKYLLLVQGSEYLGHSSWRLTSKDSARGDNCDIIHPSYEFREIKTEKQQSQIEVFLPQSNGKIYFCLKHSDADNSPFGGKWVHQGKELYLDPGSDGAFSETQRLYDISHSNNENNELQETQSVDLSHDIDVNYLPNATKPTQEERKVIEVQQGDKYVPLNEGKEKENLIRDDKENEVKYGGNTDSKRDFDATNKAKIENIKERLRIVEKAFNNFGSNRQKREDVTENNLNEEPVRRKQQSFNTLNGYRGNKFETYQDLLDSGRAKRQIMSQMADFSSVVRVDPPIYLDGLRVEEAEKDPKILEDGIPSVLADTKITLRLFGQGLTSRTVIAFTHDALEYGQPCKFLLKGEYLAKAESVTPTSALFEFWAPPPIIASKLYICAKNLKHGANDPTEDEEKYVHQGTENWKILATHNKLMPLWVALILILVCLMFSALFSGLNLGLMSLDRTELKIISNTGTEQERKYARAIMPVRDHGNYLLCSILLGNVAVNSTFTILLDELTSGLFAVIFSTLSIVLLGEITPQAICSRHGLMIGARSIMVTKAVMALTAPLAFPVSKLLDYFLGEEIGSVYNRERLKELVKVTTDVNDLDKDEVNIISGALELRKKTVSDVMTKLEDVFMLPITSILDFETMSEIIKSGYSRIPVYEGQRGNIVTVLFIKDLAFVDPDDNTPLRTLCQYYQNPCNFVFEDVTLDIMFKQFKDGHKGHMAFVHRINNEGEGDPFYETMGLVTLEDVIEEMIQAEIVDETDVFLDNRTKRRRNKPQHKLQDFAAFAERHDHRRIHISPQLTLATFQFLSTSVDAFRPDTVSETVLRRLLKQDVIQYIKVKGKTKKDPSTYVFQQGKPVDYFVLILEGRVEVTVGRENLVFEAGPFTYFGVQALTQNVGLAESPTPSAMGSLQNINMDSMLRHTFVPDYSVRAITELYYLTVKRTLYLAAKRATLMEKGALSKGATNEQFDTEVDKNLDKSLSEVVMRRSQSVVSLSSGPEERVDKPKSHTMEFRQLSQNVLSTDASPSSSDKEYIAKYLSDKLARKFLARSESQLGSSSRYWTNKDSGRTDSQTANTSRYWKNVDSTRASASSTKKDERGQNGDVGDKKSSNAEKEPDSSISINDGIKTRETHSDVIVRKEKKSDTEVDRGIKQADTNVQKDIEPKATSDDTTAKADSASNLSDTIDLTRRRDSQIASSSKYFRNIPPRASEAELIRKYSASASQDKSFTELDLWRDVANCDDSTDEWDKKGNKKKAQFRTEKSLLTFHPHTDNDSTESELMKQDTREPQQAENQTIEDESTQKLILKKLTKILRLLEKKDQT